MRTIIATLVLLGCADEPVGGTLGGCRLPRASECVDYVGIGFAGGDLAGTCAAYGRNGSISEYLPDGCPRAEVIATCVLRSGAPVEIRRRYYTPGYTLETATRVCASDRGDLVIPF